MNLTTLKSLTITQLKSIIDSSIRIKQDPQQYEDLLRGKSMYMLFEKTSTRTALSFGLAFSELGGRYFIQKWQDSNFTVGEISDEVRYVARNVDIILARLKRNEDIEHMARFSPIPVINGCCEKYHPTQSLADCMTVKEKFHTYEITMVYIGVWNNVFNSLVGSIPRLGGMLVGVCPIINPMTISEREANEIVNSTENLELHRDISPEALRELVNGADVVYTDTWVDMEFISNPEFKSLRDERISQMGQYQVTSELLTDSRAVVMHDMPIHSGYEIEREVVEEQIETILDQGENRRHVAKGLFAFLMGMEM
ncbi:MAG: ornithine carbamoyltransferase [Candidatus Latescibacteria bacterium]|nr:ornithine carbamoyltransferase [Candidatus Latescibacterota bacterium]